MFNSKNHQNGSVSSNIERLRELTGIMTAEDTDVNDTLLLINDELKKIKKQLNDKKNDKEKLKECQDSINYLMGEIKSRMNDNIDGSRKQQ